METAGLDRFDDDHEKYLRLPSCIPDENDDNVYSGHHLIGNKTVCALKDSHNLKSSVSSSVKSDRTICSGNTETSVVHKSPGGQSVNSKGSHDPDLYAPAECVSSYVDLFLKETDPPDNDCNGDITEGSLSEAAVSQDTGYQNSSGFSADQDTSLDDMISVSRQVSAESELSRQFSSTSGDIPVVPGFQDLLSHSQPGLESFSINSFDSDSGTASRFNSTTSEHIESIPEVAEATSPVFEPSQGFVSTSLPSGNEVLTMTCGGVPQGGMLPPLNGPLSSHSALEVSVENLLAEADEEVLQITTNGSTSEPVISLATDEEPPVISLSEAAQVEPEQLPVGNSHDSPEEPSIYDLHPPLPTESDNESPNWSVRTSSPAPPEKVPSAVPVTPPPPQPKEQEVRARVRTLSSAFGDLEFGESIHLPEGCVRQWAAEIVIALIKLHELKFVCRFVHNCSCLFLFTVLYYPY